MSEDFGPRERELLETGAARFYAAAVEAGRIAKDDPRLADEAERLALDLLVDIGLLGLDPEKGAYLPVDPTTVQSRVVTPMGQRATQLLEESGRWSELFAGLGQTYRRSAGALHPITQLRGLPNINRFLTQAVDDAQEEILTAQPTRGRSATSLESASARDLRAVQRGIHMRTLYQHSARRSLAIRQYVESVAPYGAQVRTLEEFFNRMIVVDRTVAVVPGTEGNNLAIAVHEPALVTYLVDIFERYWERARAYDDTNVSTNKIIAGDVQKMTVRMLVEGHSDPASAKRVGVSTRTYAGYIAALKDEYGVQTRFQLGYAMGQLADHGEPEPELETQGDDETPDP